jgi:hypothetical protein
MTITYDLTRFTFIDIVTITWIQIVGWVLMVVGFVLVLYSRLYLVILSPRTRRILLPVILTVIIGTDILTYTLIIVVTGMQLNSHYRNPVYTLAWRLQLLSPVEEIVLASLYVFFFVRFLRDSSEDSRLRKKTFYLLCIAQALIAVCDIGVVVMTYRRLILLRSIIYPFLYALKLEFEFIVLNRLVSFTRRKAHVNSFIAVGKSKGIVAESPTAVIGLEIGKARSADIEDGCANLSVAETPPPLFSNYRGDASDDILQDEKNSVGELERRYLGQYRAENSS